MDVLPRLVRLADGAAVLQALRGGGCPRPSADRAWCGGLRDHLEDVLAGSVGDWPDGARRVTWRDLEPGAAAAPGPRRLADTLVGAVLRLWVVAGHVDDAVGEALEAVRVAGDPEGVLATLPRLSAGARARLDEQVRGAARWLAQGWPTVDGRWAPVTDEVLLASLAGGRVVVEARPELAVGLPARGRASRCFLAVAAGVPGSAVWRRLWLAALVEALRSGVAPFQLAVLSPPTGSFAAVPVHAGGLWAVAEAVAAAVAAGPAAAVAGPAVAVAGPAAAAVAS